MATFKWTAKDSNGKKLTGEFDAAAEPEVIEYLERQELTPLKIVTLKQKQVVTKLTWLDRLSLKDKLFFIQSLTVMVRTGVPILDAIESLRREARNKVVVNILASMRESVMAGKPLYEVFKKYNRFFHPLYAAFIKGGEATGRLKESLEILYAQLERDYDLSSKIRAAMIYPAILVLGVTAVLGVLFGFVLPKLKEVFLQSGIRPHPITGVVFKLSDFLQANGLLLLVIVVVLAIAFFFLMRNSTFRLRVIELFMYVPRVGNIIRYVQLTRFSRSLSAGLGAGLSFPESLNLTAQVLQGSYQNAVGQFAKDIEKGVPLSLLIKQEKRLFPGTFVQIVAVGEKTGELPQVLSDLGDFYQKETDNAIHSLISLIEPSLILVMGVVVGFIVISIVATIFNSVRRF